MVYCKKYLCKQKENGITRSKYVGWERLSAQKLKIDEIYNAMIVKPIEGMGKAASMFDKAVLDRIVNFVANGAEDSGKSQSAFRMEM
jgi:NADH-quinone oxidoreductase subunit L